MSRRQDPKEDAETYTADILTKANQLGWNQDRTVSHLIAGLNNKLKPFVMMKNPQNLKEASRAIQTASEAVKIQGSEIQDLQTTLKDLVVQLKTDKDDKKVSAVTQQPSPPIVANYTGIPTGFQANPMYHQQPQTYNPGPRRFPGNRGNDRNRSMRPVIPIHIHNEGTPVQSRQGYGMHKPRPFMPSQPESTLRCWTCGSPQHFQSSCPQSVCRRCNRRGHVERNCSTGNRFQRRDGRIRGAGRPFKGNRRDQEN